MSVYSGGGGRGAAHPAGVATSGLKLGNPIIAGHGTFAMRYFAWDNCF
ncbi:hypothetical protein [Hymenobacter rubidus]|nr:hypothetical protein [Hymenobacter rubidus]